MASSEQDHVVDIILRWQTQQDAVVCPICQPLHDREWRIKNLDVPTQLQDFMQGPVWDTVADHSLAHGDEPFNCRCWLKVETEIDANPQLQRLREILHRIDC